MKKDLISAAILFWVVLLVLIIKNENVEKLLVGVSLLIWWAYGLFSKDEKVNSTVITGTRIALFQQNYHLIFKPIKLQNFIFKVMFKGKPLKQNYLAWGLMVMFTFALIFTIAGLQDYIRYPVYIFGFGIAVISLLSGWVRFKQWLQINKMAKLLGVTTGEVVWYLNNQTPDNVRPKMI